MTSYCPQTRFAQQPDKWWGGEGVRYPTPSQAQASLAEIIATRADLLETRIVESIYKPNTDWVIWVDPNGEKPPEGIAVVRGRRKDHERLWSKKGFKMPKKTSHSPIDRDCD